MVCVQSTLSVFNYMHKLSHACTIKQGCYSLVCWFLHSFTPYRVYDLTFSEKAMLDLFTDGLRAGQTLKTSINLKHSAQITQAKCFS